MKFGQLIEYDMSYVLLEKSFAKYGGETIHMPFYKMSKSSKSLDQ